MDEQPETTWSVMGLESWGQVWVPEHLVAADLPLPADEQSSFIHGDTLKAWHQDVVSRAREVTDPTERWILVQLASVLLEAIPEGDYGVIYVAREPAPPAAPVTPGTVNNVDLADLGAVLHDAWIDFESISNEHGSVSWTGWVKRERLRYTYDIRLTECTEVEVVDESGIGGTLLGEVERTGERLLVRGHIPAHLAVTTSAARAYIRARALPSWQRRWWRWIPVEQTPTIRPMS
jgi:hypothetical protein